MHMLVARITATDAKPAHINFTLNSNYYLPATFNNAYVPQV